MSFQISGYTKKCVLLLIAFPLLVLQISCRNRSLPNSIDGVIDLSSYSFEKNGPAVLRGNWLFRYNDGAQTLAEIPSNWKHARTSGPAPGAFGHAEYTLRVMLPDPLPYSMMLKVGEIGTASTVFLNGTELLSSGRPGRTAGETAADVRVRYATLPPVAQSFDILVHVSNFADSNGGGVWGRIFLGTAEQITRMRDSSVIRESFMAGLFFIVSLYYLVLYIYRKNDRSSLLFSLICAAFFLRQISIGEKILLLILPSLSWNFLVRIEYLSLYSLAPLYILFFKSLFPFPGLLRTQAILTGIGIAGTIAVAVLPVPWFVATLLPFQIYWVFLFLFNYYVLIAAIRSAKDNAWIFLGSFSILVASAVNDLLLTRIYMPTQSMVTFAQAVFIFFQSLALSHRFAREYRQTKNLSDLNLHLSELDKARTRFFTASSHELRTPVTLITTPLEAIMSGRFGETIPRDAPVFGLIKRNCDRLKHLADELLDFLRFDSGAVQPVFYPIDLAVYLENYVSLFVSDAKGRGIAIESELFKGAVALVDPVLLETVVLNLFSNALKNTPSGGTVTVSLVRSLERVSFIVSDTGIGIPPLQIPHLFERFTSASAVRGTGYSGFGIGLPLSAEIVKTLNGTITVESRIREGTSFTVSFPAHDGLPVKSDPPSLGRAANFLPSVRRSKAENLIPILAVDDDPDMTGFLADILSFSFEIHTASSASEAISLIEQGFRPRVIISDVMMPVMDGFALRERIASMEACQGVPFLFLSAKADPEVIRNGLASGAVDYIMKPFSIEDLSAKISSLAALAQAERDRLERKLVNAIRNDAPVSSPERGNSDWRPHARSLGMTDRDLEVLELVIRGLSDKEIAGDLDCSPRTVSNRISTLLKRTNTPSRASLIAFITRNG